MLLIVSFIIYLIGGLYVIYQDKKSLLNRVFLALNLCFALYAFSQAFMITAPDKSICIIWSKIASLSLFSYSCIALHFALIYTEKKYLLKKWWTYVILYIPFAVFYCLEFTSNFHAIDYVYTSNGWVLIARTDSILFLAYNLQYAFYISIGVFLCFMWWRKADSSRERKQASIVSLSCLITFIFGLVLYTISIIKVDAPNLSPIVVVIWSLGILYGIVKYRLMTLSPSLASESILQTIVDSVILVNPQGQITYVNTETLSLLGYIKTDLLEKPIEILFPTDIKSDMINIFETLVQEPIRNKDSSFISKNNTQIPILFSAAVCNNNDGEILGFVVLSRDITEYKQREEETLNSKIFLETLLESISLPLFYKDINGRYLGFNNAYQDFFGKTKDELIGKSVFDISPDDLARIYHAKDVELFEQAGTQTYESKVKDTHGIIHDVIFNKASTTDSRGKVTGLIGTILDISARKRAEEALQESEIRFRTLFESAADAILLMDQNIFIDCNKKALVLFGCTKEQFIGQAPYRFSPEVQPDGENSLEKAQEKITAATSGQPQFFEWKHSRYDGTLFDAEISLNVFSVTGKNYLQCVVHDITERKYAEEEIQYLATHDSLTGLPNRFMFTQLLNKSIQYAKRHKQQLAVFFIDLDRFKIINDTKGHDAGDQLLQEIAERYKQSLRAADVVSRQGGDEFVVLIEDVHNLSDIELVATNLLANTIKPIVLLGDECRVTASIGISLYPKDGEDAQSLMKNADMAMYYAKEEGKNNYQFYSKDIQTQSSGRLAIETNLRFALERNEFSLHYQAKVDVKTGIITGVEALLRWQNPVLGSVTPMQFIPVAEETGMIISIGKWVLKTACAQNVAWQKQGLPAVCMAVNLSVRQLMENNLINEVKEALNESGMAPNLLELEITESMIMRNPKQMLDKLNEIKCLGVRLAIDDFGTGYSSLAQIRQFPITTLKIDRSFIRNIPENDGDNTIITAIITMGEALGLTVVAEGVETMEQLNYLKEQSCDEMQGYFFSKPIEPERFADLLRKQADTSLT